MKLHQVRKSGKRDKLAITTEASAASGRRVENGRLAYYERKADAVHWEEHWQQLDAERVLASAEHGVIRFLKEPFLRYLPRNGIILEAGCGLGQYVLALRSLGYQIEGVEWASQTVERVRLLRPDLPIRVGDVTRLGVPDSYYSGYISLGVVEHCYEGPQPFLCEAHRVLAPGGIALISVPHFNSLRRLSACMNRSRIPDMGAFYQYAFRPEHLREELRTAGFRPLDTFYYDPYKGLRGELSWIRRTWWHRITHSLFHRVPWTIRHVSHMVMVIAENQK